MRGPAGGRENYRSGSGAKMTARDFEHIMNFAHDQMPAAIRQRFEASTIRLVFFSDPDAVLEIRWTKK
jgi:hypothetical protein